MNNVDIVYQWWRFVILPEVILGLIGYVTIASFPAALYAAGVVAAILIIFAMACNNDIGVAITTASLTVIIAIFCAVSGASVFTVALALVTGALVFLARGIAGR